MTGKTVTLTRKQYAHLVRDAESALKRTHKMKGGAPDDYGAPQTLETYLVQHPMSMIEFYVDAGGIPMGGAGLAPPCVRSGTRLMGIIRPIHLYGKRYTRISFTIDDEGVIVISIERFHERTGQSVYYASS